MGQQAAAGAGLGGRARCRIRAGHHQSVYHPRRRRPGSPTGSSPTASAPASGRARQGVEGVVTGRKRRCGWFDMRMMVAPGRGEGRGHRRHRAHQARRARRIFRDQGLHRLSPRDGETHRPAAAREHADAARPKWCRSTRRSRAGAKAPAARRSWAQAPGARRIKYIRRIEELIEAPVALLSTSPERDDTVLVKDPFEDWSRGIGCRRHRLDLTESPWPRYGYRCWSYFLVSSVSDKPTET